MIENETLPLIRVLVIEDSTGDTLLLQRALHEPAEATYQLYHAQTLEQALTALDVQEFDIALLDRTLPDASQFEGLSSIQNRAPKLPIIFLTGCHDEEFALTTIKQGAQDYLNKDHYDGKSLRKAIQYAILRKEFEAELIHRAYYDTLTGLANRTLFNNHLNTALSRANRQSGNLCVFFIDLNDFKQVNDLYGHRAGDRLLIETGKRLNQTLRHHDIAARLGGDEFAILLDSCPREDYVKIAQRIIDLCTQPVAISEKSDKVVSIGISIGIAEYCHDQPCSLEELLHQADTAMYQAKLAKPSSIMSHYTAR